MKKKYIFVGDLDSINLELICKSHPFLKNKVNYLLLGNIIDISKSLKRTKNRLDLNEIYDPYDFNKFDKNCLNIFNIENVSEEKFKNLLNQINVGNYLSNVTNIDLVTLPINKSVFKKKIPFIGMTEYLSKINNKKTTMLMKGEKFSIIPLTTHINLKNVNKFINKKNLDDSINEILSQINKVIYGFNFKKIIFLCVNPHCSEDETIGEEDKVIFNSVSKFNKISGPYAADSAFKNINQKSLFISMYHDQALIPFKILNNKSINLTLGLNYRRISPAHGTARDIKYKNIADISSYMACMEY